VLNIANVSNALDSFDEKIIVIVNTEATKTAKISIVKNPKAEVIMKNQKEIPADTAIDLNREEIAFN